MNAILEESANRYDELKLQGQKYISRVWKRLPQATRDLLMLNGYSEWGTWQAESEFYDSDIRNLEYVLGIFLEAATSSTPTKGTDEIPRILLSDDVLNEAALCLDKRWQNPEFAALAINAIFKKQTARSLELLYFNGGTTELPKHLGWRALGTVVGFIVFGIGLPIAIGYGLAAAAKGDGGIASVCAFFSFIAVKFFRSFNPKNKAEDQQTPYKLAYQKWTSMLYTDFHIGTGHGLKVKLEDMVRQGISVPSVLFDLCAIIQKG